MCLWQGMVRQNGKDAVLMAERRTYNTRQRQAVLGFLAAHADRYLSVDEVHEMLHEEGIEVGRTTAWRTLEALTEQGSVAKVVAPGGAESRYRLIDPAHADEGQLVCLRCGRALLLDCDMLVAFRKHVLQDHGFQIDPKRTVLYGLCRSCLEAATGPGLAKGTA